MEIPIWLRDHSDSVALSGRVFPVNRPPHRCYTGWQAVIRSAGFDLICMWCIRADRRRTQRVSAAVFLNLNNGGWIVSDAGKWGALHHRAAEASSDDGFGTPRWVTSILTRKHLRHRKLEQENKRLSLFFMREAPKHSVIQTGRKQGKRLWVRIKMRFKNLKIHYLHNLTHNTQFNTIM